MSYFKLNADRTVFFDVDSTLIDYKGDASYESNDAEHLVYKGPIDDLWIKPIMRHVRLMRELKNIGFNVVVWSQSGADHCERVILLLKIDKYVDLIVSKPELYVDDLLFENQGIPRVFKK